MGIAFSQLPKNVQDRIKTQHKEFREAIKTAMKNKFGAVATNGMGSKFEAAVYRRLVMRQKSGEIEGLECQTQVDLGWEIIVDARTHAKRRRRLRWKVDFSFIVRKTKKKWWAEAKGVESALYKRQLAMWRRGAGPGPLEIYKGHWREPRLIEIVIPKRGRR